MCRILLVLYEAVLFRSFNFPIFCSRMREEPLFYWIVRCNPVLSGSLHFFVR